MTDSHLYDLIGLGIQIVIKNHVILKIKKGLRVEKL